ncbi:MAG: hypothetical protein V2A73_00905, partial [Pseudomonadota bacterium]
DIDNFVVDAATRRLLGRGKRAPREQLLVAEGKDGLELALFVDENALANLEKNDPRSQLDDRNLQDFLLIVEGVSHFVYLAWRARHARPVSVLEMELQAEVDKYVTCLLTMLPQFGRPPSDLRCLLFDRFQLAPDLDYGERERYLVANCNARSYAASLDDRYVRPRDYPGMLRELRWFYRLDGRGKLDYIARAASP